MLFKKDLEEIGQGLLKHWEQYPQGKLATIILCDQLSRNIYRGLAGAFSFDHISLRLSKEIIQNLPLFKSFKHFERLFIIMPLLHSENINDCQYGIDVLNSVIIQLNSSPDLVRLFELNYRWGLEHLDTLKEFGRYPHRNKVLGRENTEEEDNYIRETGSFGQQLGPAQNHNNVY